jgi:peptide deformylase
MKTEITPINTVVTDPEKLMTPLETFSFTHPPVDPVALANVLIESMIKENGLGISANQLGYPYRVFVLHSNPTLVCFNPKIIDCSEEQILLEEGCLSFPNLFVKIKRPRKIRVRFTDAHGHTHTKVLDGMSARVFLHEYDHLEGVIFYQRASSIHRDAAFKKQKQIQRMKKKLNDPVKRNLLNAHISEEQHGKEEATAE